MFIKILTIIFFTAYYIWALDLKDKEDAEIIEEKKNNPIIILYNFINDDYITFLTIDDFYRDILKRKDRGCMIEYLRKHGTEPESYEEIKSLIRLYYNDYEIKKLDLKI